MASHYAELLKAAGHLLKRRSGQRGKLPGARIRRSVSTTYYALFHFLLDEIGISCVGTGNHLRVRRRLVIRTVSHRAAKLGLERIRGATIDTDYLEYFGLAIVATPRFARELALLFADAQAKRHDADYNLNAGFTEADAAFLRRRVSRVIRNWRSATSPDERSFKKAICLLILLKGQLRPDNS